jgi:hypothetical protein
VGFTSGTREVGEDEAVALAGVPPSGMRVRNLGGVRVYLGGPDVTEQDGFPVDAGGSETFPGSVPKESPVVPAPEGDMAAPVLYARTAEGTGITKVSFIAA